jgi:hypothetical protein
MVPLSILGSSSSAASAKTQNNLPMLAAIDALSFGVQIGFPPLLVLFSENQLKWKNFEANLFISATNIARATILAIILPAAHKLMSSASSKPGSSATVSQSPSNPLKLNMMIIRLSLLLVLLSNIGFAFSKQTLPFALSGIISAAGAPVSPLILSTMTNYAATDRIGELFGAISLLHALSRAAVPALMQFVYSLTLGNAPTVLFLGLGALFGIAFLVAMRVKT